MKFGRFEISIVNFGFFRLDGGSMFGSVPKNLWSKLTPADSENCIRLATNSLVIRDGDRCFLTDVGLGEKWSEKNRKIFGIENTPTEKLGLDPTKVTDIILTHMHFDHAGGISRYKGSGPEVELSYPRANVFLQKANYENAKAPGIRERASYLPENVLALEQAKLNLVDGSVEIHPDIWVHRVDGHTRGQQWIEVRDGDARIVFPTDMIPTSAHLPVPYNMGYDMCTETILREKNEFLSFVLKHDAIVVFQHDPKLPAARVQKGERGHLVAKDIITF